MKQADEDAFRAFVLARSPALLRSAYVLTGDRGKAEDLVQTALARAYSSWHRIRDPEAAEAYVRTTMNRTAVSWWRRRWHGERPAAVVPDRPAPDSGSSVAERDALDRALERLSPRQQAVLVLRYYEDLSCQDTAEALGCSVGAVKQHTARGLAELRRIVTDDRVTEAL